MYAVVRPFVTTPTPFLEQALRRSALTLGKLGFLLDDLSEDQNEFTELGQRLDFALIFELDRVRPDDLRSRLAGDPKLARNPPKRLPVLTCSNLIRAISSRRNTLSTLQAKAQRLAIQPNSVSHVWPIKPAPFFGRESRTQTGPIVARDSTVFSLGYCERSHLLVSSLKSRPAHEMP